MSEADSGELNFERVPYSSRTLDSFQKLHKIGEGAFAEVYKAKEIETGEIVALKKFKRKHESKKDRGVPIAVIREIKILSTLHHENIIKLKEVLASPGPETDEHGKPDNNKDICLVFEYMDHDLKGLLDLAGKFSVPQIKCCMKQLLTGLNYCHENHILHRDLKATNLLVDNNGTLKLADFGLARNVPPDNESNLTNLVITLSYRPPELLLGSKMYGPAVDVWSVGCIFAELLEGKILFPGKDEVEQLSLIFDLLGFPDESCWPGVTKLPVYKYRENMHRPLENRFRKHFRHLDRLALEFLEKMLILDPAKRMTTADALGSAYFLADPLPCDPQSLPKYESSHGLLTKKKQQAQQQQGKALNPQALPFIPQRRQAGPNQPMLGSRTLVPSDPGHVGRPHEPLKHTLGGHPGSSGMPGMGPQGGGFSSHAGPGSRQQGVPYHGSTGSLVMGPQGGSFSGHVAEGAGNYPQGGPYYGLSGMPGMRPRGGSSSGRGGARHYPQGGPRYGLSGRPNIRPRGGRCSDRRDARNQQFGFSASRGQKSSMMLWQETPSAVW